MRPISWLAIAVVAAVGAVVALWPTDERDRIRAVPHAAAAAFNDGDVLDCLDAFDAGFEDSSDRQRVTRDTLRMALLAARARRDGPAWIARIVDGAVTLDDVDLDSGRARARFGVELLRDDARSDYVDGAEPVWSVAVDAGLARDEAGTWRFTRSTHRTLRGAPPRD